MKAIFHYNKESDNPCSVFVDGKFFKLTEIRHKQQLEIIAKKAVGIEVLDCKKEVK